MKNTILNHYIEFSSSARDLPEKDALVVWQESRNLQNDMEKSARDRIRSLGTGDVSEGQLAGYKFEFEMWKWLTKLRPQIVNNPGYQLRMDLSGYSSLDEEILKPYQNSKQTDVFATFNDHVFVVECKSSTTNKNFSSLNEQICLLRDLIKHKDKRILRLFGERAIPVHILAIEGFEITQEQKAEELKHVEGNLIILTEKEREYIDIILENSESPEFALNQFLGFFRTGKSDFNKWIFNKKKKTWGQKPFKVASFSSNSGTGKKSNVFTFSIEPRDMLKISTVSHQKAKNIFEFERSSKKFYQRLLTGRRLKEIGEHLENEKTPFPNNILVSHRGKSLRFEPDEVDDSQNSGRRPGKLVFNGCPGTFHVIDGQHRLFGYMAVDDKEGGLRDSHRLIVTVFDGLSIDQEAEIFIEVNEKSQAVASDLMMEIDYATESESKSNLCNGIIFNLRDDPNSVLFDRIAPAEEKRKKGLQPWDLKPTDMKNVLMDFRVIGNKEKYKHGIFYETDYNKTAKNLYEHLNILLKVIKEECGFWHNNIPSKHKDKDWYKPDMGKSSKGFLQNIITKGILQLFDRITFWSFQNDITQTKEALTNNCVEVVTDIFKGFNELKASEKYKYFDVRSQYGQGTEAVNRVCSMFLVNFLDREKYPSLITDVDIENVSIDDRPSKRQYEDAMERISKLEKHLDSLANEGERARILEGEFRSKINHVFEKMFGKEYFSNMFLYESKLRGSAISAIDKHKAAQDVLQNDPDQDMGLHDSLVEYMEWVDWIEIIRVIVNHKDYYQKNYLNKSLTEDLETIIRRVFYVDNLKPITQANWKEGTNWMTHYNTVRRVPSHPGTAELTPTQRKTLQKLEPKVTEKIKLMTSFYMK
tara:strand:- start:860 stop:3472 length:2613 start_codon:yes stop_codon:yes gene_type:complete